jgi:glycolate oxidase iron-sulfur subunit
LIEFLRWAGLRVSDPEGQQCCGALASHTGRPGRAATLRTLNDEVFAPALDEGAVMITEAAGCGHELKSRSRGAESVKDAVEYLASLDLPALGHLPLKVALHDPCHARHGQGLVDEPRRLLALIPGLEVLEPVEAEVCCGSGGAWGLRYPDLSADLGNRKAGFLAATGADVIVTSNPGCLGQIADGLELIEGAPPILPLTDILWYAASLATD